MSMTFCAQCFLFVLQIYKPHFQNPMSLFSHVYIQRTYTEKLGFISLLASNICTAMHSPFSAAPRLFRLVLIYCKLIPYDFSKRFTLGLTSVIDHHPDFSGNRISPPQLMREELAQGSTCQRRSRTRVLYVDSPTL